MSIRLQGVTKCFGETKALDGIDFDSGEARAIVLIGPSGGGKSTFLRVVGGLETPEMGELFVDGKTVPQTEPALLEHRRRNGFLFQAYNLFPHLSALQNIALPLREVHGLDANKALDRAQESLARFGLGHHGNRHPAQLSGGQQQRVGLARAMAHRPRLLLLDEPTSALDPEITGEVLDLIRELVEQGQRILLSTHEMGFARAVADHVAFLAEGQIVEQGSAKQIFESPGTKSTQRFLRRVTRFI